MWVSAVATIFVVQQEGGGGGFVPVDYPPIHNHHSRIAVNDITLGKMRWYPPLKDVLQQNHQDNNCAAAEGGPLCALTTFPRGLRSPRRRAAGVHRHVQRSESSRIGRDALLV